MKTDAKSKDTEAAREEWRRAAEAEQRARWALEDADRPPPRDEKSEWRDELKKEAMRSGVGAAVGTVVGVVLGWLLTRKS